MMVGQIRDTPLPCHKAFTTAASIPYVSIGVQRGDERGGLTSSTALPLRKGGSVPGGARGVREAKAPT